MRRLLLDREAVARGVELRDAVPLGVLDPVAEDRRLARFLRAAHGLPEHARESRSVEDIVAQHQTDRIAADELLADQKRLRQPVGRGLFGVLDAYAVVRAVAQQPPESREVGRRRDHEYLADAGQHQRRNRIINHGLVINGQQLLAHTFRDGIQARARASG